MDVIIKSFNRPYYLERCLHTLYTYVTDLTGDVYVLDDGTPEIYLAKIKMHFLKLKYLHLIFITINKLKPSKVFLQTNTKCQ